MKQSYRRYFFDHPLIEVILKNELTYFNEADKEVVKPEYCKDLQTLENEMHVDDFFGGYLPSILSLFVTKKNRPTFIDRIFLNYIPPRQLQKLLGFEGMPFEGFETSFPFKLFIELIFLTEDKCAFIEESNKFKLNFEEYNYYLKADYISPRDLEPAEEKIFTIVHVDDHPLYSSIFHEKVGKSYFKNSNWHYFQSSDEALDWIITRTLYEEEPIDLVISDMNRPGIDGLEFCRQVKKLENDYLYYSIPIALHSLAGPEDPRIIEGIANNYFDLIIDKEYDHRETGNKLRDLLHYVGRPFNGGFPCINPES